MQDRFKFRVWDKNERKYLPEYTVDFKNVHSSWVGIDSTGVYLYERDENENVYVTDISEYVEVEQCTGLKDKNGNLIYEGDIVTDGKDTGHIFWKEDVGAWAVTMFLFQKRPNELEIIGNIHENGDLKMLDLKYKTGY